MKSYLTALSWYAIFGALHELFHIATAFSFGLFDVSTFTRSQLKILILDAILYRQVSIPGNDDSGVHLNLELSLLRLGGWSFSVMIAILVHLHLRRKFTDAHVMSSSPWIWCIVAAYVTALDALATDLFGLPKLYLPTTVRSSFFSSSLIMRYSMGSSSPSDVVLCCGNFGVILLHSAWFEKGGKYAYDILEKMIQVTMMRGAQSGGVVTFQDREKSEKDGTGHATHNMTGIRTRVVKSKRGDLSKILRSKLEQRSIVPFVRGVGEKVLNRVKFYAGHTRFATTSKATFDGTHPHQWSKPQYLRVYNMDELLSTDDVERSMGRSMMGLSSNILRRSRSSAKRHIAAPCKTRVENFITHNGDFEFYELNGTSCEFEAVQKWLEIATGTKMPSGVDSAAIAGMVDIIRCKGCFALSVRYVICLGFPTSKIQENVDDIHLPSWQIYEKLGIVFEDALREYQNEFPFPLDLISQDPAKREGLARKAAVKLTSTEYQSVLESISRHVGNEELGAGVYKFAVACVNAFFDNDLLQTVKIFMAHSKGSFGLCVMSSLDSNRQICLAARGQTISVAFYPQKHIILYGSEQAAVKAGMGVEFPGLNSTCALDRSHLNVETDVLRLDLDDLGGEICLIDWGSRKYKNPAVSPPNRSIKAASVMNNEAQLYLIQESMNLSQPEVLYHRMTKLTKNRLITPLKDDCEDPILQDIRDIPTICGAIQDDWLNIGDGSTMFSLNRLTAWNLGRCIKERLEKYASGELTPCANKVDILLTGCEVSLWLAEQFASDLQKAFPKLHIIAVSSNKLLGLYGQEGINIPTIGFPVSEKSLNLFDAITIIVSHSGGTFSPLGCSNLFQSKTNNIFVVTSEWDTQIGKQLRSFDNQEGISLKLVFNSRIFSTGVGMRPAEPCSVSVAATHQLLTNIFEFISIVILSDDRYRKVTGAVVTLKDLEILERCNRENVSALEDIVGTDVYGNPLTDKEGLVESDLRKAGDLWSDHILENARAYIISFVYIVATVVSGYPIATGIAAGAGVPTGSGVYYFTRFIDALIYFFLPQINVIILRLIQRRQLLHRMVCRTVVIGDIPWVAQSAEAFLSKIFACSYSIAGLNVLSANPSDHLVHRMTHRVVRGSLLICGRPDGRLSALTAAESAICLSINQASSIQSLGSTCESMTIGHNPFKLPLTAKGIFLKRFRPLFLCEYLLGEESADHGMDVSVSVRRRQKQQVIATEESTSRLSSDFKQNQDTILDETIRTLQGRSNIQGRDKITPSVPKVGNSTTIMKNDHRGQAKAKHQSSAALLSKYKSLESKAIQKVEHDRLLDESGKLPFAAVLYAAINEKKWSDSARRVFEFLDKDKDALLCLEEFVEGLMQLNSSKGRSDLTTLFHQFENDGNGYLTFDQFYKVMTMSTIEIEESLQPSIRDKRGLIQVQPNDEGFFGQGLIQKVKKKTLGHIHVSAGAIKSQNFAQELYESRIASLQRFVAMTVMFHQMGWKVEHFFRKMSLGLMGYRMDRTHSIMRIATTASPVSGADVRDRKRAIFYMRKIHRSVNTISAAWLSYKERKENVQKITALKEE